jgi:hypothetical protein
MFWKSDRSDANIERGNAAVVALCVTTLAVGVVLVARFFRDGGSTKPTAPIAAADIGAGESDADPSGIGIGASGPIRSAATSGESSGAALGGTATPSAAPVPTLPGSVPTIPPDGAVPVAAPVPVVAVEVTTTTTPPVILGLKTPQAASRNLFDAWRENDRSRARRFALSSVVDVMFRQPWGAEVQDDGCSETGKTQSFRCAFVGDVRAWIVVVDQRTGPTGREFIPTRIIVTDTKDTKGANNGSQYAPPSAVGTGIDPSVSSIPDTTIDQSLIGEPLVDPAGTPDAAGTTLQDPSLLDPAGAAAALAEPASDVPSPTVVGSGGLVGSGGTKAATATPKPTKKKKSTVRRPKSAVSSSKSVASTDAGTLAPATPDAPAPATPKKKAAASDQPTTQGSGEPAAPGGAGAVNAGAPPVNQVDG